MNMLGGVKPTDFIKNRQEFSGEGAWVMFPVGMAGKYNSDRTGVGFRGKGTFHRVMTRLRLPNNEVFFFQFNQGGAQGASADSQLMGELAFGR